MELAVAVELTIEAGFAKIPAGEWLMGRSQPTAAEGRTEVRPLRGLVVRDRSHVRRVTTTGRGYCGSAAAPFLTRLDALPDEPLKVVSAKVLVAPYGARTGARAIRPVPMGWRSSTAVTEFTSGWAVAATRSRVTRVALEKGGESVTVRPEALVAWTGENPTGSCRRLTALDLVLPRLPDGLAFSFHGPAVVWFEGSAEREGRRRA